jgi:hypothetical protein
MYKSKFSGLASYMPKPQRDWCRNENCLRQVSMKVAKFSKEKFGIVLCWNCQRLDESERRITHE